MPLPQYKELLLDVWRECKRVLRPGGRLCVNVAGVWRQPYLPLHSIIWQQLVDDLGFQMRGEIIWDKRASVGESTAWGSFASPSNPTLRDVHEYIVVFSKDGVQPFQLPNWTKKKPDIANEDFVEWTKSVWHIVTESSIQVGHPAPFPVDLPRRLILLYTYPGDIVLDPFAGSGSTCIAAKLTNRHYIGYDIDEGYVRTAVERIKAEGEQSAYQLPRDKRLSGRRHGKIPRAKSIVKVPGTCLVGPGDNRDRELSVTLDGDEIVINIKTSDVPDRQKQNLTISLEQSRAQQVVTALSKAIDGTAKSIVKVSGTCLVSPDDERKRELSVTLDRTAIVINIKTVGNPDRQKQNLTISLDQPCAQQVVTALSKAIEGANKTE
jgi:DNA modification methylase/phosphotransferase system HPr-like phosphotransfer protein